MRVNIKVFMGAAIVDVLRPDGGRRDHRELSSFRGCDASVD